MSLFCCTRPRAYSSSCSPSEVELNPRAPTPVPPSPPPDTRRKAKWVPGPGRRHSKQDIEAFYQEGKRLQQEEELLELGVESLAGHSSAGHNQTVECEPKQSLVACRDDDATAEASSLPQRQSLSCLELASSGLELDNGQNGQQKSGLVGIAVEDIPKVDQSGGNIPCSTMAGLANATPKSAIKLQLPSSADALSKEKHTAEILEKENSIQPGIGTNICADLEEKNDQLDASSRTIARPSMPGAFTPGYPSYSASEVSISHPMDPKELFFKIPMLLEPSSSSLATRSASPSRTFRTSISDNMDLGRTPKANRLGTAARTLGTATPSRRVVAKSEKLKTYLDSSSSYYASEASSLKSSVEIPTTPVPPIPAGIVASMARCFSTSEMSNYRIVPTSTADLGSTAGRHLRTSMPTKNKHSRLGNQSPIPRLPEPPRYTVSAASGRLPIDDGNIGNGSHVTIEPIEKKNVAEKGNKEITAVDGDISTIKDGSSIWGCEASKQPLLPETGIQFGTLVDKRWEEATAEETGFWKSTMTRKTPIVGASVDDVGFWLEEQFEIGTIRHSAVSEKKSRSMTFKKTFTKSMSKLRSRLSSNLKSTGSLSLTVPGYVQKPAPDGRGYFTRLHTPAISIPTERNTNPSDFINISTEDVTPNSEQVMANITFSPSLPREFRMDGSVEEYEDFQGADLRRRIPEISSDYQLPFDRIDDALRDLNKSPPQHRYSAIYDDCVVFPFGVDAEDDDASATNSDLITPCTFSTASEMQSKLGDAQAGGGIEL